jgi:hypothetical protein
MTLILRLIDEDSPAGVFDDHATKVMGEAFDAACKDLDDAEQHAVGRVLIKCPCPLKPVTNP